MYYPSSENIGADQLRSYCTADLRLCFRISKIRFSHDAAHLVSGNFDILLQASKTTYYICKIKGADQPCSSCTADQGLCFHNSILDCRCLFFF